MGSYDIGAHVGSKKKIGYGTGQAFFATDGGNVADISYFVDDRPGVQGTTLKGVPVFPVEKLLEEEKDGIFIVIYAYRAEVINLVSAKLRAMGFREGEHYADCSFQHAAAIAQRLAKEFGADVVLGTFDAVRDLFLSCGVPDHSYASGTWLFIELLENFSLKVKGEIAECGVYKGGNAFITLSLAAGIDKKEYLLFDSFKGFPELSEHDPAARGGDFVGSGSREVKELLGKFRNAAVHEGFFRDSFRHLEDRNYSMVYIDCDLYVPALECGNYFYGRLNNGGVMMFHDYHIPEGADSPGTGFRGIKKAVDEFLSDKDEELIVIPETSHAFFVKGKGKRK
ncbi:MAG: class I SAM-dependent methyltransferase [Candidatus Omnitrophica bacterium]|nr:class I SAM-dependent methyltransferase [Candidatus Omnitrophota bacterium]